MNAGLSNLAKLKAQLLPGSWAATTAQDAVITALGLGVAGLFEAHTGRKFARVVGENEYFEASGSHLQLHRLPVETLSALALQSTFGGTFDSVIDNVLRVTPSGIVTLAATLDRTGGSTLRATYTGGFWYDTAEDNSGVLPGGATALPATLQTAWFMQCKALYARTETDAVKAGLDSGNLGALSALLNEAQLLPVVVSMLNQYRFLAA